MERHFNIHNQQFRRKSDVYVIFLLSFSVIGLLSFLSIIIPEGELTRDISYQIISTP